MDYFHSFCSLHFHHLRLLHCSVLACELQEGDEYQWEPQEEHVTPSDFGSVRPVRLSIASDVAFKAKTASENNVSFTVARFYHSVFEFEREASIRLQIWYLMSLSSRTDSLINGFYFFFVVSRHRTLMNVFDKAPIVDKEAFVAPSASVIGNVQIGRGSSIWYGCVLRGDQSY